MTLQMTIALELLNSLARKYKHLRIFDLEKNLNFFSGKKFPLSLGIKSAQHEISFYRCGLSACQPELDQEHAGQL